MINIIKGKGGFAHISLPMFYQHKNGLDHIVSLHCIFLFYATGSIYIILNVPLLG